MIAFLIITCVIFCFFAFVWGTGTFLNVLVKMLFTAMTIWAALLIFSAFVPGAIVLQNGMRLW